MDFSFKMLGEGYGEEDEGLHLSGYLIEPFPVFFHSLDTTKVIVKILREKYEEEHDRLYLSGYLIEPFPEFVHGASWSRTL